MRLKVSRMKYRRDTYRYPVWQAAQHGLQAPFRGGEVRSAPVDVRGQRGDNRGFETGAMGP